MTGSRILVVDDEPGILRAVERVLGDIHQVCGTSSSKDAVSLAAEFLPTLAIVDIRMPEVDGFELMVLCRLGYEDPAIKRPTIDWSSPQRKGIDELAFQDAWGQPINIESSVQ